MPARQIHTRKEWDIPPFRRRVSVQAGTFYKAWGLSTQTRCRLQALYGNPQSPGCTSTGWPYLLPLQMCRVQGNSIAREKRYNRGFWDTDVTDKHG